MELLEETAEWLLDNYKNRNDEACLKAANQVIQAYMELGLPKKNMQVLYGQILQEFGSSKYNADIPKIRYPMKEMKTTKSSIREILGGYPKGTKKGNADWIAEDIEKHVKNHEIGKYTYRRGGNKIALELVIIKEGALLLDLERKRIFLL